MVKDNLLTEAILNFELGKRIGLGGEGEIYLAKDVQLNAEIAIKKIPLANFPHIDAFFEEARKLYLTRHHNIVEVNYACKDNDFVYISMPYYNKGSVKDLMSTRFLTSREIIRYSLQFLSGLNNVHTKKLIHFDIKTENLLLSNSNQALLSDFGVAQYTSRYGFAPNRGTTAIYAPPELFQNTEHNLLFDIYQAGIAMYRMCNGDVDFNNQINQAFVSKSVPDESNFVKSVLKGTFPDRKGYLPHIPKPLAKIINKTIHINPAQRTSSVIDILNDLSRIEIANDWLYQLDVDKETWTKKDYVVESLNKNGTFAIASTKSGRRNTQFSKQVSSFEEQRNLLYDCLNTAW